MQEEQEELRNSDPEADPSRGTGALGSSDDDADPRELVRERDELKDLLLRKQAEFENFRKRTERERSEFVQYAAAEVMRELLNVLDSFELALKTGDSGGTDPLKGFALIHKQLVDTLSRAGLKEITAAGQPFDPNVHEAVTTQPAPDGVADGTVLTELRRGYELNGKLLRPTMVSVASRSGGDE
jgi:molecular chaperone GrpE